MASTVVALQDLPATDAKLVRYLLLLVVLHFHQNHQLAMYQFKHLMLNAVECWWPINMDQYLNPYYMGSTLSNNVNDVIPTYVFLGRLQGPPDISFAILLISNSSRSIIFHTFSHKRVWEHSLFKQRNMHWWKQRIQLQLSTRIFGKSMWN